VRQRGQRLSDRRIVDAMGRAHRIQASDAVYHVTTRGVRRLETFEDSLDYMKFEALLEAVVREREWAIYAYCQMPNHYHLLFRTPEADISDGMFWLNGVYARWFNARHNYSGHVFEERFYSEVVRSNAHLLSLACYIPLNPVRAGLCQTASDWPWSSYRATVGRRKISWLSTDWLLEQFGNESVSAAIEYQRYVSRQLAA
jgi:putative transposase